VGQDYDLFEMFPDHSLRWRVSVHGTQFALATLEELARQTNNECFATDIGSQEIIGRVNKGGSAPQFRNEDGSRRN